MKMLEEIKDLLYGSIDRSECVLKNIFIWVGNFCCHYYALFFEDVLEGRWRAGRESLHYIRPKIELIEDRKRERRERKQEEEK